MTPPLGTLAPDFELPLAPGEAPLRLSDYRGQRSVVLLFFPLAFSGTCTRELSGLRDNFVAWESAGVSLLGISVDSPYANQFFAEECRLPFPILSDFNRDAVDSYGVRNDDFMGLRGVAHRSVFVVDREGVLRYSWMSEDADVLPDFAEVKALVDTLA